MLVHLLNSVKSPAPSKHHLPSASLFFQPVSFIFLPAVPWGEGRLQMKEWKKTSHTQDSSCCAQATTPHTAWLATA